MAEKKKSKKKTSRKRAKPRTKSLKAKPSKAETLKKAKPRRRAPSKQEKGKEKQKKKPRKEKAAKKPSKKKSAQDIIVETEIGEAQIVKEICKLLSLNVPESKIKQTLLDAGVPGYEAEGMIREAKNVYMPEVAREKTKVEAPHRCSPLVYFGIAVFIIALVIFGILYYFVK